MPEIFRFYVFTVLSFISSATSTTLFTFMSGEKTEMRSLIFAKESSFCNQATALKWAT